MKTHLDRFWKKVDKRGPEECWEWVGSIKSGGYGQFKLNGSPRLAHRVSYEIHNGPIPKGPGYHGTCVCHTCDNPPCVNPAHLWLGTNADNVADKVRKGRSKVDCSHLRVKPGQYHPSAKVTWDDVENIRANTMNLTQRELGEMFGIARSTVSAIQRQENWGNDGDPG